MACLTLSLPTLIKVITIPKTDTLGIKIGPAVGWGLWLLVFSSAALCVTAIIVATQIAQKIQLLAPAGAGQSEARLVNGSRWVAIVASALVVISGIVYYSITWHGP